jgi:4-aminobutyrate aminotransferase-like enzyme
MEICKDNGVLVGRGGLLGNVLRLTPPLVVDATDVQRALTALDQAFESVEKSMTVA